MKRIGTGRGYMLLSLLTAALLAATVFAALPAAYENNENILGDPEDYNAGDIAVVNSMIENNGLNWTLNDPDSWPGVMWTGSSPDIRIAVLDISSKYLTGPLDLSCLTELMGLDCYNNDITSLDVSGLTSLAYLNCNNNSMTSLNISGLTSLTLLYCNYNYLTSLDISGSALLENLDCSDNRLTSLDASGLTSLKYINCNNNSITSLNVSGLTSLLNLHCNNNSIQHLDLTGLTSLDTIDCGYNDLTFLDASGLTSLEWLYCDFNRLTSMDLTGMTSLLMLSCDNNLITSLDLTGLTTLRWICCGSNLMTSLDLLGLTSLSSLDCSQNLMEDQSKLTNLHPGAYLYFYKQMKEIDITGMSVQEIADRIKEITDDDTYYPLVTGTGTFSETLTIGLDGCMVFWMAEYTGGMLVLSDYGDLVVNRGGAITVSGLQLMDSSYVFVGKDGTVTVDGTLLLSERGYVEAYSGTVTVNGDAIVEGPYANITANFKGKTTVSGNLIDENDSYSCILNASNEGIIAIGGDIITSGVAATLWERGTLTVGGNVTAGGRQVLECKKGSYAHVKGDVSAPNGRGVEVDGRLTVKIDGSIIVGDGEAYICDSNSGEFWFADDFASENTDGYAFMYTDGHWQMFLGSLYEEPEGGNGGGEGPDAGTGDAVSGKGPAEMILILIAAALLAIALTLLVAVRRDKRL